ncbi:Uncharacterised protein [Sphingobacterium multivorum]|uniref:hypothetical protein n=1 Tax=Sphingobacterium multivorum TaxID=28454 RepID=UPI000E06E769|nr:hypothetical protein [Sphingobacterium multivorum]QQT44898.1 hypothetical protein I6J00_24915 [Sphingobacterium multivorum]SUJ18288.1 Uncharacterised protein [Sphingobacterium multivorum]
MKRRIKSVFDAMDDIQGVLIAAGIPSMINGELRTAQRRAGSTKEDVVTNSLIYDAEQKQGGIFNINVHVPNLKNQTAENPTAKDNTQPDAVRMRTIGAAIVAAVDDYHGFDFSLSLRNPGELEGYNTDWLFNIQVYYNFLRTDITS